MPLFNVRLGAEDARRVRGLRARGVSLSDVVRQAIRAEAERARAGESVDVEALMAEMLAAHPTPAGERSAPRPVTTDRPAVQRHIRSRLRRA